MERKEEFVILADALSKSSITKINEACRLILKERIGSIVCTDKEVLRLTEKIIAAYSPLVEMNVTKRETPHKETISTNKKIICGVVGVVGFFTATLYNNVPSQSSCDFSWMRLFGCAAFGAATAMGTLLWEQSKEKKETVYQCEIKQEVEDIINELDVTFDSLKRLLMHNQLEDQYSPILKWIQELWAESANDLQTDIGNYCCPVNFFCILIKAEPPRLDSSGFLCYFAFATKLSTHEQKYTFYRTAGHVPGIKIA